MPTALAGAAELVVMLWAGGWLQGDGNLLLVVPTLLFVAWALAPFAGMVGAVVLVRRRRPRGVAALAPGVVVLGGLTAVALVDFVRSESSTAALLFLFLPLYQWVVVGVAFGLGTALHAVLARRAARSAPAA